MARKLVLFGIISLLTFVFITAAYCDTPYSPQTKKLGRGLCNIGTFPLELFEQPKRAADNDGPMAGVTYGVLKGVVMSVVRLSVGIYEVVTFPFPIPKDYAPILNDPEFFFQDQIW